jgi:hypothetical protein
MREYIFSYSSRSCVTLSLFPSKHFPAHSTQLYYYYYHQTLLTCYCPICKTHNPTIMDPPGYRPSRQNRDWCDIDRPKSMFREEHRGRFGSPPPAESEEAKLRRHPSLSRDMLYGEETPPSLSTLIARHRSQIRWRKAEEAHEKMMLKKLKKRSGRVSKPGQKSTRKMTDLTEAIRRGKCSDFPMRSTCLGMVN